MQDRTTLIEQSFTKLYENIFTQKFYHNFLHENKANGHYPKLCETIQVPYTISFMNAILSLHFRIIN